MNEKLKVIIRCLVYNHEPYLRDCLEGFVTQKTNFPFKAVVHDDCSTDGSAAIIREYAEKHPNIIEPIFETENQYSKKDGSLRRIMDAATQGRSEYIALCEGDDYWTDPLKLQKQVDYMDTHPQCSMVCTNALVEYQGTLKTPRECGWPAPEKTGQLLPKNLILCGGDYVTTATMLYRANITAAMPEKARKCDVGDYPLQIFSALYGYVQYFDDITAVYRFAHPGSWTEQYLKQDIPSERANIAHISSVVQMLKALNEYSKNQYSEFFVERQLQMIYYRIFQKPQQKKEILSELGWALKYSYVSPHLKRKQHTLKEKVYFYIVRLLAWPYYPRPYVLRTLLPSWHPVSLLRKILVR